MAARLQFQRRAYIAALTLALLSALLVMVSPATPASAATSSQYASSWSVDNNASWTPFPPNGNPLGSGTSNCTGGNAGAWAEFTFTGFSIPAGDDIDGIVVTPKYRTASTNSTIALRDGGAQLGSKALPQNTGPSNCDGTSTLAIGGATDTWGASLTPAQINDGIQVRITMGNPNIDLDNIQLTVHHSAPSTESDLSVTISDSPDPAIPGESVVYTIVAANAGPDADPAATLVSSPPIDALCSYTSSAAGGATGNTAAGFGPLSETLSLPSGSSVTYTVDCTIDPAATNFLTTSAQISASVDDPNTANNDASESTDLAAEADVSVTKTDGVTTAVPGESVTYEIVVTNAGPSDDGFVSVDDTFSPLLTCTYTSVAAGGASGNTAAGAGDIADTVSLPVGSSVTYTADCDIDSSATGFLWNTATVAASATDPDDGNDSASDVDTLTPEADLSITKDDGVTTAVPGESVTYEIVAANAGPSDDPGVTVEDTFPAELSCTYTAVGAPGATGYTLAGSGDINDVVSLPAGSSVTYTAECDIDEAATGDLSNTATVTASATDPDAGNDSATDVDTLEPASDLAVAVTESADPVTAGDADGLTYTVEVANDGPSVAENTEVEVDLTLPDGVTLGTAAATEGSFAGTTWSVGSLAPGDEATLTLPLAVAASTEAGSDVVSIEATASSDSTDEDDTNDSATEATSVEAAPVAPTTTTTTTTPGSGVGSVGADRGGALPRTGAGFLPLVLLGLLSMLGGGLAVWSAERRNAYVGTHLR